MSFSGHVLNMTNGEWWEGQYRVDKKALHQPTDCVDLYVDVVCHIECTTAQDRHIHLLTLLPQTTFQFHSVSCHTTCTYRLTWNVYKGTVTYWSPCKVTGSRMFVHIMCNVWWIVDTVDSKGTCLPMEESSKFEADMTKQQPSCEANACSGRLPSFHIRWWFTATFGMLSCFV